MIVLSLDRSMQIPQQLDLQEKLRAKDEKINEAWNEAYQFKKVADRQKRLLDKVPKDVLEQIEGTKTPKQERQR